MERIPNSISARFNTQEGRRFMIREYGESKSMYSGNNELGERVYLSIAPNGMVLKTEQDNGWLRVNYYDENGFSTGETFEGRWR